MKFRSYSLAALAGTLIAGSVFAQGTTASQPAAKATVAGETAKIDAKADKAPAVKADTSMKQPSSETTKMVKKHKHVTTDATAKKAGETASTNVKQETKKEVTSTTKTSTSETSKAGAGPNTSVK